MVIRFVEIALQYAWVEKRCSSLSKYNLAPVSKAEKISETEESKLCEQNSSETQGMQQPKVIRKQSVPLQLTKQYPQCVLLTGVTGFLGAHILEQLLTLPHTRIYCLARSQHGESVEQRVMEKMKFYFDETTLEQMKHRVQVIEGDLREKHVE
ncbi:SDR family oxidoreductase [Escherichia sp. R-CC3]